MYNIIFDNFRMVFEPYVLNILWKKNGFYYLVLLYFHKRSHLNLLLYQLTALRNFCSCFFLQVYCIGEDIVPPEFWGRWGEHQFLKYLVWQAKFFLPWGKIVIFVPNSFSMKKYFRAPTGLDPEPPYQVVFAYL